MKKEPHFSEAAHYYKAFALAKKINWEQRPFKEDKVLKEFKQELREAARLLDEHCKFSINAASIIGKIKKNNNESIIQIDAYEEQKKNLANLYYIFSRSIDDIFGHVITPRSFAYNDVTEELAKVLYDDLLREGVLKKQRVKKNIPKEELKTISLDYGIPVQELKDSLSKYEGKEIDDFFLLKALKRDIRLPSREGLWRLLIQEKVLSEEVKYVIVDNRKLKKVDSPLLDFLTKKVNEEKLKKQVLEANNKQILLNIELITQQRDNDNIFMKEDFIEIVGKGKYEMLKVKGVLSFNRKALVNLSKIESTVLSDYDSITIKDFTNKANITESEAEKMLVELAKLGVLEKCPKNRTYRLKIKFDEIEKVQLPLCSVYENAVRGLLSVCFTYRIALQKIASQLEAKYSPIHLQLMTKPHQSLVLELLEQQIIKPVTVARKDNILVEKAVKKALNKLQLTKENITKNVIRTLERSRSSLKALKVPDCQLKSFTELCGQGEFANIEEVHVFSLNGLDKFLQLEEKKWTQEMLLNTKVVAAMGISQIAIGTVIELYSVGIMTHVGAAFVDKGVNDLFFATSALLSGYLSWEDYRQDKLESLMRTAVNVGIGAFLSRGAKVSRFGHKLAGPSFEIGEKKVSEISGTHLIGTLGRKVVGKEVTKCTLKALDGVAFCLANAKVDTLIENNLQGLCECIASDILSNIEQEVEKHNISSSLKELYKTLGEKKAKKIVNDLNQSAFTEQNCEIKFLPIAMKIVRSITRGIAQATKKRSKMGSKLELPVDTISKIMVWSQRSVHINKVLSITGSLLNNLDQKIKGKLSMDKLEKSTEHDLLLNQKQETGKNWERFIKEVIDQRKSLLHDRVGLIIEQHIVSPILKEGTNHLIRDVGKKAQQVHQSYKESEYLEQFGELKQEYKEKLQNEQQFDEISKIENHIAEKYNKVVLKLMKKTRNPYLFADIVRENISMDMTCVSVCTQVIHKILKEQGVQILGLTIIVEGDNGIRQKFSSAPDDGVAGIMIKLTLQDNHFQLCRSSALENNRDFKNCLYEALSEAIPQVRNIAPEKFRAGMANCIELDPKIRYHIKQGQHQLPISLDAFGGASAKKHSKVVYDPESSSLDNEGLLDYKEYQDREHNVSDHFQDRFVHLGRIIQRLSKRTNIIRDEVIRIGGSRFQNQSTNKRRNIHAANVTRAGKIHYKIKREFKEYKELRNFLGHTQNVQKYANEWHGVGKDIHEFQSKNLTELKNLNFGESLTAEDAHTIKALMDNFISILDNRINSGKLADREKLELMKLETTLSNVTTKSVFEKGRKDYSDEFTDECR